MAAKKTSYLESVLCRGEVKLRHFPCLDASAACSLFTVVPVGTKDQTESRFTDSYNHRIAPSACAVCVISTNSDECAWAQRSQMDCVYGVGPLSTASFVSPEPPPRCRRSLRSVAHSSHQHERRALGCRSVEAALPARATPEPAMRATFRSG